MVACEKADAAAECRREIGRRTGNRFSPRRKNRREDDWLRGWPGQYDSRVDKRVVKVVRDGADAATANQVRREPPRSRRDREPKICREDGRMPAGFVSGGYRGRWKRNALEPESTERNRGLASVRRQARHRHELDTKRNNRIEP